MPPTDPIIPARRRVFDSVFSPASLEDFTSNRSAIGPTSSSPFSKSNSSQTRAQSTSHRRSRSSTATDPANTGDEPWHDQATWDRAWRTATRFLSVPDRELDLRVLGEDIEETRLLRHFNRHTRPSKDVTAALAFLTAPLSQGGTGAAQRSIIDWYGYEIRRHFLKNFRGSLHAVGYLLSFGGLGCCARIPNCLHCSF